MMYENLYQDLITKASLEPDGYLEKKLDEDGKVVSNKERLEAIRILLVFVTYKNIKPFQIDVRSAFLNGFIKEVYVKQPTMLKISNILTMF
ncbi:hypothetical protein CR513_48294, partial [Mucuna pruriens]